MSGPSWADFLHMTPDGAALAMFAVTGRPYTPSEAKAGMLRELAARAVAQRDRIFADDSFEADPYLARTADTFRQDSIGRRHPSRSSFGTTLLYKLIAGKRLRIYETESVEESGMEA